MLSSGGSSGGGNEEKKGREDFEGKTEFGSKLEQKGEAIKVYMLKNIEDSKDYVVYVVVGFVAFLIVSLAYFLYRFFI